MKAIICQGIGMALMSALPSGTSAAFSLQSVSFGSPVCTCGSPVRTSTAFYQDDFGNNYPPSHVFIGVFPSLEDDSYVLMDATGPSTPERTALAPSGSTPGYGATVGHFSAKGPGALSGEFFHTSGLASATSPFATHGVMIAQLTTDGELTGGEVWVFIEGAPPLRPVFNGVADGDIAVRSRVSRSAHNGMMVHQVWIIEVPSPGAAAVLLFGGWISVVRRNRRSQSAHARVCACEIAINTRSQDGQERAS